MTTAASEKVASDLEWHRHLVRIQAREASLPSYTTRADVRTLPCMACEEICWIPPGGIHCVECLARGARKRAWSPAEDQILRLEYGRSKSRIIQEILFRATTEPRSKKAIIVRARDLKLDHRTNQSHLWTVRELCELAGVTRHQIYNCIRRGIIRSCSRGKIKFFSQAAIDTLMATFQLPPFARTMTRSEMMQRLGYSDTHASRLLKAGVISGIKCGTVWLVDADHVAEIAAEMLRSGTVRLSLLGFRGFDRGRAISREYREHQRLQRRRAALEAGQRISPKRIGSENGS